MCAEHPLYLPSNQAIWIIEVRLYPLGIELSAGGKRRMDESIAVDSRRASVGVQKIPAFVCSQRAHTAVAVEVPKVP